jgi:hypothetical protein
VLGTDNSKGDASPSVPGAGADGQLDSLDISAIGFGTANGGQDLQAQIKVISLSDGTGGMPATASGQVDNWFAQWTYGGTTYYLRAQYASGDPTTTTQYTYGTLTSGAGVTTLHQPSGPANGSVDVANAVITISIPLSSVGSPPTGAQLANETFETDVQVGSPLYSADTRPAVTDYDIGDSSANGTCRSPKSALPGTVPTAGGSKNLAYYGGPTVHHIKNYLIFWLPQVGTTTNCVEPATSTYMYEPPTYGAASDSDYEAIIQQYFKDLPGTSFYNLLTQYADQNTGAINNDPAFGGVWVDSCGYTSTPQGPGGQTVPGGTTANPVYDYDVQQEVLRAMAANNGWHDGLGSEYYVYLGFGAATCFNGTTANPAPGCDISGAPPSFCAYHGDFTNSDGNPVIYSNMTDGALQTAFTCYQSPINSGASPTHFVNGTPVKDWAADAEIAITSHEEFETVTDWSAETAQAYAPPLSWYSNPNDLADGEIGDKCAYKYGNWNPADGANITLRNGDRYIVQQEYSNWAGNYDLGTAAPGCALGNTSNGTTPYGGATDTVAIQKGWNLISVPASGIANTNVLTADMTRKGQLPAASVQEEATYHGGHWNLTIPGYSGNQTLSLTEGVFVLSSADKQNWTPTGNVYTSPPTVHFGVGWNLVAPTWPNPGVMTDAMLNQIEAENHSCTVDASNPACAPTVSEIAPYASGSYLEWRPAAASNGHATWPQTMGDSVPFTNGMWVQSTKPLDWIPQGVECQAIGMKLTGAHWTAASGQTPATATLTFPAQVSALPVDGTLIVSGVQSANSPGFNGTFTITASTSSSVSYALPSDPGVYTSGGNIDNGMCS